jgi:hypothetical protein
MALTQSPEVDKINVALCKFQKLVGVAAKTSTASIPTKSGGNYSYNYATLEGVWAAARENDLLSDCGLSVDQTAGYIIVGDDVLDTLITTLNHISGQFKSGERVLRLKTDDPQGQGSAITYSRRYDFCAILGIVQADDDAQGAQKARAEQQSQPRAAVKDELPPCPTCGKNDLRRGKNNPGQLYCWKAKGGCGYDSDRDGLPDLEDGPPFAEDVEE